MKLTQVMAYKRNKYNAKKTVVDGIKFDSRRESKIFEELKIKELAGEISELKHLDRYKDYFVLQEGFYSDNAFMVSKEGTKAMTKLREAKYTPDFSYTDRTGKHVVVEVKGKITAKEAVYVVRKKLFLKKFPDIVFLEWY